MENCGGGVWFQAWIISIFSALQTQTHTHHTSNVDDIVSISYRHELFDVTQGLRHAAEDANNGDKGGGEVIQLSTKAETE